MAFKSPRLSIRAITRRRVLVVDGAGAMQEADRRLNAWSRDMIEAMARYPPALPWKNRPPKTGPRRRISPGSFIGRRTGNLGRSWRETEHKFGSRTVSSNVDYSVYVQGRRPGRKRKRQTKAMRARGWQNISQEGRRVWKEHRPGIVRVLKRAGGGLRTRAGGQLNKRARLNTDR